MATYKVKATYSVDVEIEIDAANEEEAISKLIQKDFRDIVEDGNIWRADSENETAEISEADYKVRVKGIDYSIEYYDITDQVAEKFPDVEEGSAAFDELVDKEITEIKKSLPQSLDLDLDCVNPEDLDWIISDAISEETGWLINGFDSYEILEVK